MCAIVDASVAFEVFGESDPRRVFVFGTGWMMGVDSLLSVGESRRNSYTIEISDAGCWKHGV